MECTCYRCVAACKETPGWLIPGQAEEIAKFLGIPFSEIEKYLILDHASNHEASEAPYVYTPRRIGTDRGRVKTWDEQRNRGTCIFLKDNRCSIHTVKPFECATSMPCKGPAGLRGKIELAWIAAGASLGYRPENE